MAETYTKLLSSITDSSVWSEDDRTLRVWIAMLAMADRDGYVWASVDGLARRAIVSEDEAAAALAKFMSPDPKSRSKEHEGRRIEEVERGWLLLNHARFRDMRDEDEHRRRERERKRAQRAKEKREREELAAAEREDARVNTRREAEVKRSTGGQAPEPPTDFDGSTEETTVPLDLAERAEKIFPDLLAGMRGVTLEQLRDGAREFVSYWTIGGGRFKRRNFWMRRLRENLRQKYEQNKFRPPGAIEHDEHKPERPKLSEGAARLIQMAKEEDEKKRRARKVAAE